MFDEWRGRLAGMNQELSQAILADLVSRDANISTHKSRNA